MTNLSIIVPTYNGKKNLPAILASLNTQSVIGFEVIIVVDGSTDDSIEFLKAYYTEKFTIRTVVQKNSGRAIARNNGTKIASNALLLFIDDDMTLEPRVIEGHLLHHQKLQNSILIGGQFLKTQKETEFMTYRQSIEKDWYSGLPEYPTPMVDQGLFVTAAHLSIGSKLFNQLGKFDERLTDCEDIELGFRAFLEGTPIYFNKLLTAYHNDQTTSSEYALRRRQYKSAWRQVMKMNPKYQNFNSSNNTSTLLNRVVKRVIGHNFFVKLIDLGVLKFIPKEIRYKLYSAIVWTVSDKTY